MTPLVSGKVLDEAAGEREKKRQHFFSCLAWGTIVGLFISSFTVHYHHSVEICRLRNNVFELSRQLDLIMIQVEDS